MIKKDFTQKCKKVFTAILAAAVVMTTTVPENLVWANEPEETCEFGEGGDEAIENSPDEITEDTEEDQDAVDFQIGDTDDAESAEEDFSDGEISGSDANDGSIEEEFQDSVSVDKIQERINTLPTVEEFQAMTAEEKMSVYENAQEIADEYESLTEEEQGQVDTSNLEALFELMNGEMDLLANAECEWGNTSDGTMTRTGTLDSALFTAYRTQGTYYIKLLKDVAMQGNSGNSWTIKSGREVHIDLNGHTLSSDLSDVSGSSIKPPFSIDGGTLFISDSSEGQTGVLDGTYHKTTISVRSGGTFILDGGTITKSIRGSKAGEDVGDLIYLNDNSDFIMNGGKISVASNAATCVNMQGYSECNFIMNGGTITENNIGVTVNGCVIDMWRAGNFEMNGGTISQNTTKGNGGAISVHGQNTVTLNGGTICNNEAAIGGGAIYIDGSSKNAVINLKGTTISGNRTNKDCGGAISSYSTSSVIYINAGEISNNHAKYHGGGIYTKGRLVMTSGTIKGNETEQEGGGVYLANTGTCVMAGGKIESNKSGKNWAGAISDYGTLMIGGNASVISNTNASGQAANIYLNNDKTFTILNDGDVIDGNTTISGSWNGKAGVKTDQIETENTHRQITTNGTTDDLRRITSDREEYQVGYEDEHLYLFKHTHEWTYSGSDNVVTAKCSVDTDPCDYHENGLNLTITADNMIYSGEPYNSDQYINIVNEITDVTKESQSAIQYFAVDENGKKTGAAISAPSDVGAYIAEVSIGGVTATAGFKIILQNSWTTKPSISGWIYGNTANAPEGSAKYGTVSVTYAKAGSDEFTSEVPTESGTYTARFAVEETDSYSNLSEDVPFTIEAREVTVKVADKTITYGDAEPEYTSGITEGSLVGKDELKLTYSREKGTSVKTYTITASSANCNYKVNVVPGTLTIRKKDLTIVPEAGQKKVYGDANPKFQYRVNGLVNGEKADDVLTGTLARTEGENKGTYAYEIGSLADISGNYNVTLDKNAAEFTITAKEAVLIWSKTDLTYTGIEQSIAAQVNNPAFDNDTFTLEYTGNTATDAGDYKAEVISLGNDNYVLEENSNQKIDWSIAKKTVIVAGITAEDKIYDGNISAVLNYDDVKFNGMLEKDSLSVTATGAFEDKNVGQKKVLVSGLTLGGTSAKNYVLAKDGQQSETTATIIPKEVSVSITPNGGTYEGTITGAAARLNGAVAGETPEVVLTYTGTANDGTEVNVTEVPTHAGTYTVTASITDENYSLKAEGASAEFVVAKADPALSISAVADKNYGEEAFKLEISNKGDGQKTFATDNDKVVTVDETGLVTIVGAGKATLTVSLAESANYKAGEKTVIVTVKKVDHKLIVEKLVYEVTYGDKPFKIAASVGDKETDIKFASNDNDVASVSGDGTVTVGNVGTAKITVSMDESQNYLAVAKEVTVTVAPKEVTVTPDDASKVYGEKDGDLSYRVDTLEEGDTLTGITLARAEGENVGRYDITASEEKDANPNYSVKFEKGTFTITQKEIDLKWTDTTLTYNGKEQQPKAEATGLVGKDTCEVTVTGAMKNVGTYTATAIKLSNQNYKLSAEVTTEYTIGAKEIGIEWSNLEFTYDGTKKQPTAKATGLVDGDACGISVSGAAVSAGNHTAKADAVNNANYKLPKDVETSFIIKKAESTVSQTPEIISNLTYTGEAQDLITAGQTEDGKFVYKVNDGEWSETIPSGLDAGTYEITYKVAGDDNHNDSAEGTLNVSIAKKTVVVSGITAEDKTYDGNIGATLNFNGVKFDGLLEKDSLSVTAEGAFEDKNAGADKKVTVSNLVLAGESIDNYVLAEEGQQSDTTATIIPKAVTVIPDNVKKFTGEADPKLTYKVSGLVGNDTLSGITLTRKAGEEIGKYDITASAEKDANPNYSITFEKAVFSIEQGDQSRLNAKSVAKLDLPLLLAKGQGANKSIKLSWLKYKGATGYDCYWSYCDGKQNYKKFATVKNGKLTAIHKKLKNNSKYKYFVVAYKMVNGKKIYVAKSNTLHVAMKQAKETNAKSVSVNKTNIALRKGKTFCIKAGVKLENRSKKEVSHAAAFRYYTVNENVATVSSRGVIKAHGKGTTYVYVLANNGAYKKIKVTVK